MYKSLFLIFIISLFLMVGCTTIIHPGRGIRRPHPPPRVKILIPFDVHRHNGMWVPEHRPFLIL